MSFVEFTDCPQVVPPYFFPGVTLKMFWLGAERESLQDWCDAALNINPDHQFEALMPFVLLTVIDYPRMILEDFPNLGYSTQTEYAAMFPVVRFDNILGLMVPVDVTWAVPFIGVDLINSALAGQMVLGFLKSSGEFIVPPTTDGSYRATVRMPGMIRTQPLPQDDRQELVTILEIETGTPSFPTSGPSFPSQLLAGFAPDDFGVLKLLELLDDDLYSLTNLKQIRDPADPPNPVYQALVRAEWHQTKISNFSVFDGAQVQVIDNENVRIAEVLGLTGGVGPGGNVFKTVFAASVQCDLRLGNATTIVQTA